LSEPDLDENVKDISLLEGRYEVTALLHEKIYTFLRVPPRRELTVAMFLIRKHVKKLVSVARSSCGLPGDQSWAVNVKLEEKNLNLFA
jgi:hypothetical protein